MMRLDRFLTEAFLGTRKKVRSYVQEGAVQVNHEVVFAPELLIDEEHDKVFYQGVLVERKDNVYLMFHKPKGYLTARKDEQRKTIMELFTDRNMEGIFPVGRLDMDTEGLLFLTNDGVWNHHLMYPEKHVEKIYLFWAVGCMDEEKRRLLERGVSIGDGIVTSEAKLVILRSGMYEEFGDVEEISEVDDKKKRLGIQPVFQGKITITEGRKHQIKRMLKAVGCCIIYLKRIEVGGVFLDESLEKGTYRNLTEEEMERLRNNW